MDKNFLNKRQFDMIATDGGWILQSKKDWEKENNCIIISSVRFGWFIGFGYWKDIYTGTFDGYTHNYLFPFVRIQNGLVRGAKNNT